METDLVDVDAEMVEFHCHRSCFFGQLLVSKGVKISYGCSKHVSAKSLRIDGAAARMTSTGFQFARYPAEAASDFDCSQTHGLSPQQVVET